MSRRVARRGRAGERPRVPGRPTGRSPGRPASASVVHTRWGARGWASATQLAPLSKRDGLRQLLLWAAGLFAVSGPVTRALARMKLARRQDETSGNPHQPKRMALFVSTAAVSFYIGYFGAGSGFLIMTMLAFFGYQDIHTINALKVVANLLANAVAMLIFVVEGQVVWHLCLAAMVAAAVGGYCSASLARRVPQQILRASVVVIGVTMAAWFFWRNRS